MILLDFINIPITPTNTFSIDDYAQRKQIEQASLALNLTSYITAKFIFNSEIENGKKIQIVQNITQLNYVLTGLPKNNEKRRTIGFIKND